MTENALFDAKLRDQVKRSLGIDDETFDELVKRLQAEGEDIDIDGLNGLTDISESATDQANAGAQIHDQARPDRDDRGRFVNHPGPGRPRRQTEITYARILADVVTVNDWKAVCEKALERAKAGDPKAREWISNRVLGSEPPTLTALALRDLADVSDDDELAGALELESEAAMSFFSDDKTPLRKALAARIDERREAAQREAQAAQP